MEPKRRARLIAHQMKHGWCVVMDIPGAVYRIAPGWEGYTAKSYSECRKAVAHAERGGTLATFKP